MNNNLVVEDDFITETSFAKDPIKQSYNCTNWTFHLFCVLYLTKRFHVLQFSSPSSISRRFTSFFPQYSVITAVTHLKQAGNSHGRYVPLKTINDIRRERSDKWVYIYIRTHTHIHSCTHTNTHNVLRAARRVYNRREVNFNRGPYIIIINCLGNHEAERPYVA